jgi:hypothetical protein
MTEHPENERLAAWNSDFLKELSKDVGAASERLRQEDTPVARRSYTRAVFAEVEGITNYLKVLSLRTPLSFSAAELAMLKEETYSVNDKGEAYAQLKFVRIEDNLLFALRMYLKDLSIVPNIKRDDKGWSAFKKAVGIRNRVTHPRSLNDLLITDDELHEVSVANRWFAFTVVHNLLRAVDELRARTGEDQEDIP